MIEGLKRQFGDSVMNAISISLAAIMAVSLLSIFISFWITELGEKDAQAINLSGTLRMQTYRLVLALEQDDTTVATTQLKKLSDTWNASLFAHLDQSDDNSQLDDFYRTAKLHWQTEIKPRIEVIMENDSGARHMIAGILPLLDRQVELTDILVNEFQYRAEKRVTLLRAIQIIGLFTIISVGCLVFYFIRERIEKPLKELTNAADRFRLGELDYRLHLEGRDELSLLAALFNRMGETLQSNYAELETRVEARTKDLRLQTETLEFLLDTSRQIMAAYHQTLDYKGIIRKLSHILNNQHVEICLFTCDGSQPYFHVGTDSKPDCSARDCGDCRSTSATSSPLTGIEYKYPIARDDRQYGLISIVRGNNHAPNSRESQLISSTADQIALALSLAEQKSLDRRIATLDERTVIARELHDSLAQALSYLKIQVTRLQKTSDKEQFHLQQPIINELREGLSSAYRQLRELLTTFRLKLDESGLYGALEQTTQQLRERTQMLINLDYQLKDIPLTPAEEIHLMQIIREAAQNAVHHSQGTKLSIQLLHLIDDQVLLTVTDDGVGLPKSPEKLNHYGLAIMTERSRSLGGDFRIGPNTEKDGNRGTKVSFKFLPEFAKVHQAS